MKEGINKLALIAKPYIDLIANQLNEVIVTDLGVLISSHENYKDLFRALSTFSIRVGDITNSMLHLILEDNLYSAKILERTLIEHVLKVEFLIAKAKKDRSDAIYKDYLLFL